MSGTARPAGELGPLGRAAMRTGTFVLFAVAPVAVLVTMLVVGRAHNSLAVDFRFELYPQAKELFAGHNPYPDASFEPRVGGNLVWPPLAVLVVAPLTALTLGAAEILVAALGLALLALALWLVGLRDWRVYGACCLWPQIAGEMRVAHLTPVVALLAALAWRERRSRTVAGVAVGLAVAVKFFAWPLAIWLAARRRWLGVAIAAGIGLASFLSVLPFTGLDEYAQALLRLGRRFDQDSYTPFGLLVQLGVGDGAARAMTYALGAALLLATWRYRSFALAIAAALVLAPIVWLDYFALMAVPLAVARPRLSLAWLLPLATWGAAGTGIGIGDPFDTARVLTVFAVIAAIAFRAERRSSPEGRASASPAATAMGRFMRAARAR